MTSCAVPPLIATRMFFPGESGDWLGSAGSLYMNHLPSGVTQRAAAVKRHSVGSNVSLHQAIHVEAETLRAAKPDLLTIEPLPS